MEKKYELTKDTIVHEGITLYRIKALRDFGNVKKGDLGGYLEKESNLSHKGDCWVFNNAKLYDPVSVANNTLVFTDYQFVDVSTGSNNGRRGRLR